MAVEAPQSTNQDGVFLKTKSPKELVDSFLAVFRQYAVGDDFKALAENLNEVNALRQQNQTIQTAYDMNVIALSKLTSESDTKDGQHAQALHAHKKSLDDAIGAKKKVEQDLAAIRTSFKEKMTEVEELDTRVQKLIKQVKDGETRISYLEETGQQKDVLQREIERQRDAVQSELDATTERYEAQAADFSEISDDLEMIRSCVVQLRTIHHNSELIRKELKSMFYRAHQSMSKWLSRSLDESCLNDTKRWKAISDHVTVLRDLPLPNTNSPAAKTMRVAAGLRVFAHALAERIFRPNYLVQDHGLDDALAEVAEHNPNQNVVVRAALLKVLPERQKTARDNGVRVVVEEVVKVVSAWIPETDLDGFRSELEAVANKIADGWSHVQMLEELVRPSFKRGTRQVWRPLPTQGVTGQADMNASAAQPKNTKNRSKQNETSQTPQPDEAVTLSIWPFFVHVGADSSDEAHVLPGFGLTASQTAEAEDEVSFLGTQQSTGEATGARPAKKRRDSAVSFLFGKGSNGSSAS